MPTHTSQREAKDYMDVIHLDELGDLANILGREHDTENEKIPKNRGGVLAIQVHHYLHPKFSTAAAASAGEPGEGIAANMFFASEKIRRLVGNRRNQHHRYASQSANPEMQQYGGAVAAIDEKDVDVFIAFSGAPAEIDEALCWIIANAFHLGVQPEHPNKWVARALEIIEEHGGIEILVEEDQG